MRERLADVLAEESLQKWHARAQRLAAEVDALGSEFADRYPWLITELIDLFQRCVALDRQVTKLNTQVPAGVAPVRTAEMQARNVDRFTSATPSIVASTTLCNHDGVQIWPLAKPTISTLVELPIIEGAGPDWRAGLQQGAQRRREEWSAVVADHQRRAEEQAARQEQEDKQPLEADRSAKRARFGPTTRPREPVDAFKGAPGRLSKARF